jgi:hypothetical protein
MAALVLLAGLFAGWLGRFNLRARIMLLFCMAPGDQAAAEPPRTATRDHTQVPWRSQRSC